MKLNETKDRLSTMLGQFDPVGLFYSGGSDSLLLLHILLDLKAKFSVVCFDHTFTRDQKRQVDAIVEQFGIRVFSYAPSNAYLIGNGERVSMVEEYAMLGAGVMPFVRDAVHSESRCAVEDVQLGPFYFGEPMIGFTLNLFGTRKTDRHYIAGRAWFQEQWSKGEFSYFAPLWDWSRKNVKEGLAHYGQKMPKLDTGSFPMCLNCLCGKGKVHCPRKNAEIDSIDWDPNLMSRTFKEKYDRV